MLKPYRKRFPLGFVYAEKERPFQDRPILLELLDKIRLNFPDVAWCKTEFFDNGWDHSVVILDDNLVFRAPKWDPEHLLKKLISEAGFLKFLSARVPVKLPIYKYLTTDGSIGGYEKVTGQELSSDLLTSLSESETDVLVRQIGMFLTELHKVPLDIAAKFGLCDKKDEDSRDILVKAENLLSDKLNHDENEVMLKRLESLAKTLDKPRPSVPLHFDLGEEHVLFDRALKQVGVIDFGDMSLGDPAYDFVGFWSLGEEFVKRVYSHYDGFWDDELIARSKVYFDCLPISLMKDAFGGWPVTFDYGVTKFRQSIRAEEYINSKQNQILET